MNLFLSIQYSNQKGFGRGHNNIKEGIKKVWTRLKQCDLGKPIRHKKFEITKSISDKSKSGIFW